MKAILIIIFVSLTILGCKTNQAIIKVKKESFTKELTELKAFFHIPAISVIIKRGDKTIFEDYLGFADLKTKLVNDSLTTFPMASLTKIFSAVLIMKLVEENKMSLDEPINKYVLNKNIADSIKIKHILSHTSQGNVGQNFYYSGRFGWLTTAIEKAAGNSFEKEINEKIIQPLGLKNTFLLQDSSQLRQENRKIAMPYNYEGEITDGFIDYGYSASSGIVSTVRDLAKFSQALDDNSLITEDSKKRMFAPFKNNLPYGQGIFSQKFQNQDLIWGYGQYDCYSSLFLKVPDKNLTLIIAANNNLMSDPARLIYGDVGYSLFALSFLKNYVFDLPNEPLFENSTSLNTIENRINPKNSTFYRQKLLAQSIAESFMATYDIRQGEMRKAILEKVFKLYPDYENYSDLTILHNLSFLKTISLVKEQKNFTKFDAEIEKIGTKLLTIDPENPYANYYLANYFSSKGSNEIALKYYEKIIKAKNFSKNWYTFEAEKWIKEYQKKN
jgi:CubicO group peptidase (beta-lactamase class C family)